MAHANQGDDMGNTEDYEGNADETWKSRCGDVEMFHAEETEDDAADAQNQDNPPVGETTLFVVETLYGYADTLDNNPDGEQHGEGYGSSEQVEQDEAAEEDVNQCTQHTGAAVGQESLCPEGERHLHDTH